MLTCVTWRFRRDRWRAIGCRMPDSTRSADCAFLKFLRTPGARMSRIIEYKEESAPRISAARGVSVRGKSGNSSKFSSDKLRLDMFQPDKSRPYGPDLDIEETLSTHDPGPPPSEISRIMAEPHLPTLLKTLPVAPEPAADWALFLDLDGTLLDIAGTPDAVVVPKDLIEDIAAVSKRLGGALAIVSGRTLDNIDRLLAPLKLPIACEHGGTIRLPNGFFDEVELEV